MKLILTPWPRTPSLNEKARSMNLKAIRERLAFSDPHFSSGEVETLLDYIDRLHAAAKPTLDVMRVEGFDDEADKLEAILNEVEDE